MVINHKEVWKPILGYEDYQVSTFGRVRSMKGRKVKVGHILKLNTSRHSCMVTLTKNGEQKSFSVSRLVADTFLEKEENSIFVMHIDRNKNNNNIDNLKWADCCSRTDKSDIIESNDFEEWRKIPNVDDCYEASSLGNIRCTNYRGMGITKKLRLCPNHGGYYVVNLPVNGKRRPVLVNRLVCMAFHENKENKPQVNHINGKVKDNRPDNLEWCTQTENIRHSFRVLGRKGVKSQLGKTYGKSHLAIPIEQYTKNGEYVRRWSSAAEAADTLGIPRSNITGSCRGVRPSAAGFVWKYAN